MYHLTRCTLYSILVIRIYIGFSDSMYSYSFKYIICPLFITISLWFCIAVFFDDIYTQFGAVSGEYNQHYQSCSPIFNQHAVLTSGLFDIVLSSILLILFIRPLVKLNQEMKIDHFKEEISTRQCTIDISKSMNTPKPRTPELSPKLTPTLIAQLSPQILPSKIPKLAPISQSDIDEDGIQPIGSITPIHSPDQDRKMDFIIEHAYKSSKSSTNTTINSSTNPSNLTSNSSITPETDSNFTINLPPISLIAPPIGEHQTHSSGSSTFGSIENTPISPDLIEDMELEVIWKEVHDPVDVIEENKVTDIDTADVIYEMPRWDLNAQNRSSTYTASVVDEVSINNRDRKDTPADCVPHDDDEVPRMNPCLPSQTTVSNTNMTNMTNMSGETLSTNDLNKNRREWLKNKHFRASRSTLTLHQRRLDNVYEELITRYALLVILCIGSSFLLYLSVFIFGHWIADLSPIDDAINVWCIILISKKTNKIYHIVCYPCDAMMKLCCIFNMNAGMSRRKSHIEESMKYSAENNNYNYDNHKVSHIAMTKLQSIPTRSFQSRSTVNR